MNSRIPSLDLIILIATMAPTSFSYSISSIFGNRKGRETAPIFSLSFLAATMALLIVSTAILCPSLLSVKSPPVVFLPISVIGAAIAALIEYAIVASQIYLTTGVVPRGIALHHYWQGVSLRLLSLMMVVAFAEEILYRLVWFAILGNHLDMPLPIVLLVSSLCYGLNHLYFGYVNVLAKSACGIVYGGLFIASGYSLAAPVVAHLAQNLLLMALSRGSSADA